MKLLDLCAGVGGFSYAAHRLGWETKAFCERDAFCQKVLAKNFPGVPIYDDVYTFPGESFRGRIDVLTGGFPCQPFSQAGKRLGVNDERHLFPEMLRIIREVQPAWVVLENVNGLVTMAFEVRDVKVGRTKYSRSEDLDDYEAIYTREETMLLNRICEEIEREGYAVQPVIVPAVSLEADHERKRIWIVAQRRAVLENGTARNADKSSNRSFTGHNREKSEFSEVTGRVENSSVISRRTNLDAINPDLSGLTRGSGGDASEQRGDRTDDGLSEASDRDDTNAQSLEHERSGNSRRRRDGFADGDCDASNPDGQRHLGRCEQGQDGERAVHSGCGNDRAFSESKLDSRNALDALPDAVQGIGSERDGPGPSRLRHREDVRWPANWLEAATRFCRVHDGTTSELDQPDSQDNRVERLKALGNMIYWPCAFEIFKAMEDSETL